MSIPDPGRRRRRRGARAFVDDGHQAAATWGSAEVRRRAVSLYVGLGVWALGAGLGRRANWRVRSRLRPGTAAKSCSGDGGSRLAGHAGKAADELGGVKRHGPDPVAAFDAVVLPFGRSRPLASSSDEPEFEDGDVMRSARDTRGRPSVRRIASGGSPIRQRRNGRSVAQRNMWASQVSECHEVQ